MISLKTAQEIITKVTGKKNITGDTDFIKDLKLNSFDIVNIISFCEEKFKIKVPTRDVWKIRTVSDMIGYLNSRVK